MCDRAQINFFESARLLTLLKFFCDVLSRAAPHLGESLWMLCGGNDRMCESFVVAFVDENATHPILHRFWNSAVTRRENREPGCHRFKHGIWHTLLIPVPTGFTRMQKHLGRIEMLAQFVLRNKAGKENRRCDAELFHERLQLLELRSFAGDGHRRIGEHLVKFGKCAKTGSDAFLFDQTTGLQQTPFAIGRRSSLAKWKLFERDPGALDLNFFSRTAKIGHS